MIIIVITILTIIIIIMLTTRIVGGPQACQPSPNVSCAIYTHAHAQASL